MFDEQLGRLEVTIDPEFGRYYRELGRAKDRFTATGNAMVARAGILSAGLSRRFTLIGTSLAGAMGVGMATGITAAFGAAATAAVRGASNLEESLNKARETFGSAAGAMIGYAQEMESQFGQLQKETLDAASRFDAFAGAAGMMGKARAEFSRTMS